jgi:TRAP-type C4-dicarboxylate transport system permease small subunit
MGSEDAGKQSGKASGIDWALPLRIIVASTFAVIVTLTIAQVFFRFVLDSPLVWSEELVRLLLIWMTFIGAAVVCWDGRHLNVDVLFVRLPAPARRALRLVNVVLAVAFLAILAWGGWPLVELGHWVEIGALDLPESYYRVPAIIGGVLMILFILLRALLRWKKPSPDGTPSDEIDVM